ncbi:MULTISPECIES: sn-glycerol-3-phosphate ABC transporter ATP-binding protein UgpC [unclassified Mesorhizobium]|uniref:ABC transporter ATP-binding protein n=2 Tax=Mesorhizobium TaxID=68287 RepID=UPI0010931EC4|nr:MULTISPECIES: sn-glycerol-3-phosphate ABC transporter ATP-binding protein UgpC [unclassified Mesorhizobium]TGP87897.1 sn-glycerol-3-phosphate ABC transporter ATP-binding protein UgpC [Mesorhizobium sp. M8A.F.Ca.ET.218.01.1.1]TGT15695.1 sn-glycerol-3-phosphate ABC transporter ATP-binding protein UgpC [Mesorhizobium sp. M8A.F.Ca.ET.213.01.1.1]
MSHVTLEGVAKSFGSLQVIPPLDLRIDKGEFVVLVGPSGCGKTTTLRMIAGLEQGSSGRITIAGRDVTDVRPGLRNCAMVFQNYALYPHMSTYDNIAYGMKVRRENPESIRRRVTEASELLGLTPYLERKPRHLSGGQRQRVAIGRAIVRNPEVFLFDEPLSNLDAKLRVDMRTEIKQLQRRLGATAIYVTHDQVEAMTMADRVVLMNGGRVEQASDPIELYERPANLFVAGFIGTPSMNFLEVEVAMASGSLALKLPDGSLRELPELVARSSLARFAGQTVIFGIRPDDSSEGQGGAEGFIVDAIEPLGPHTLAIGRIGQSKFTAKLEAHVRPKPGTQLSVKWDWLKTHFFDPADGSAIS